MRKIIFSAMIGVCLLMLHSDLSAQKLTKKFSFGVGLEAGLPVGDAKDFYNFAGGLTLRFSYHVGPGFATLTSGGIGFIPKSFEGEDAKAGVLIPVRAGYKYIFQDRFFAMGEIGYGSFKQFFADDNDELQSVTHSGFLFAPSVGVQFGVAEIGLRYESLSVDGGSISDFGLRLGFNF